MPFIKHKLKNTCAVSFIPKLACFRGDLTPLNGTSWSCHPELSASFPAQGTTNHHFQQDSTTLPCLLHVPPSVVLFITLCVYACDMSGSLSCALVVLTKMNLILKEFCSWIEKVSMVMWYQMSVLKGFGQMSWTAFIYCISIPVFFEEAKILKWTVCVQAKTVSWVC